MAQPQRIPMRGSCEFDAFTSWRHVLYWKPGERKAAKRKYHRRWRKQVKAELEKTWTKLDDSTTK